MPPTCSTPTGTRSKPSTRADPARWSKILKDLIVRNFDANSTTNDVLAGLNLAGKRVLVTGVSAGLGVETARALVAHGAEVIGLDFANTDIAASALALISHRADLPASNSQPINARPVATRSIQASAEQHSANVATPGSNALIVGRSLTNGDRVVRGLGRRLAKTVIRTAAPNAVRHIVVQKFGSTMCARAWPISGLAFANNAANTAPPARGSASSKPWPGRSAASDIAVQNSAQASKLGSSTSTSPVAVAATSASRASRLCRIAGRVRTRAAIQAKANPPTTAPLASPISISAKAISPAAVPILATSLPLQVILALPDGRETAMPRCRERRIATSI